ncbi:uncharacterized protein [Elaeis guineensis]|uniref:uncharacterized protein isoform X2 n=1 Tax=Elaeis guineensis var. tenera TaxID=51953 RepID=UPI003C6DABC7
MSLACCIPVLECVYCLACARWAWQRCLYSAGHDSETWGLASADEFEPVPRLCRLILAVYEDDLDHPQWAPPGGYGINPRWVVHRKTYEDTQGRAPTYLIYLDHDHAEVALAIRGLHMAKESDYAMLLDNRLGKRKFDGGYVHNGLLKAAEWLFDAECDVLRDLLEKNPNYTLTLTGHSLGSGVAAMLAMVVVQNRERLGNVERKRIRCFAIAPARCMSLNLAVRYADVINSVVLQDDFLPRTATPLEDIFKSLFCLPCLLCLRCMKDTCIPEYVKLRDPRRLYAPGRLYHIVERKPFRNYRSSKSSWRLCHEADKNGKFSWTGSCQNDAWNSQGEINLLLGKRKSERKNIQRGWACGRRGFHILASNIVSHPCIPHD